MILGRALPAQGREISNAVVRMMDYDGNLTYVLTNPYGYFREVNLSGVPK